MAKRSAPTSTPHASSSTLTPVPSTSLLVSTSSTRRRSKRPRIAPPVSSSARKSTSSPLQAHLTAPRRRSSSSSSSSSSSLSGSSEDDLSVGESEIDRIEQVGFVDSSDSEDEDWEPEEAEADEGVAAAMDDLKQLDSSPSFINPTDEPAQRSGAAPSLVEKGDGRTSSMDERDGVDEDADDEADPDTGSDEGADDRRNQSKLHRYALASPVAASPPPHAASALPTDPTRAGHSPPVSLRTPPTTPSLPHSNTASHPAHSPPSASAPQDAASPPLHPLSFPPPPRPSSHAALHGRPTVSEQSYAEDARGERCALAAFLGKTGSDGARRRRAVRDLNDRCVAESVDARGWGSCTSSLSGIATGLEKGEKPVEMPMYTDEGVSGVLAKRQPWAGEDWEDPLVSSEPSPGLLNWLFQHSHPLTTVCDYLSPLIDEQSHFPPSARPLYVLPAASLEACPLPGPTRVHLMDRDEHGRLMGRGPTEREEAAREEARRELYGKEAVLIKEDIFSEACAGPRLRNEERRRSGLEPAGTVSAQAEQVEGSAILFRGWGRLLDTTHRIRFAVLDAHGGVACFGIGSSSSPTSVPFSNTTTTTSPFGYPVCTHSGPHLTFPGCTLSRHAHGTYAALSASQIAADFIASGRVASSPFASLSQYDLVKHIAATLAVASGRTSPTRSKPLDELFSSCANHAQMSALELEAAAARKLAWIRAKDRWWMPGGKKRADGAPKEKKDESKGTTKDESKEKTKEKKEETKEKKEETKEKKEETKEKTKAPAAQDEPPKKKKRSPEKRSPEGWARKKLRDSKRVKMTARGPVRGTVFWVQARNRRYGEARRSGEWPAVGDMPLSWVNVAVELGDLPYRPALEQTHLDGVPILELCCRGTWRRGGATRRTTMVSSTKDPSQKVSLASDAGYRGAQKRLTTLVSADENPQELISQSERAGRRRSAREKGQYEIFRGVVMKKREMMGIKSSLSGKDNWINLAPIIRQRLRSLKPGEESNFAVLVRGLLRDGTVQLRDEKDTVDKCIRRLRRAHDDHVKSGMFELFVQIKEVEEGRRVPATERDREHMMQLAQMSDLTSLSESDVRRASLSTAEEPQLTFRRSRRPVRTLVEFARRSVKA
ncbi:hypothetical protein JCM8097_007819 [Rhodosporidiobolus ruineniae]